MSRIVYKVLYQDSNNKLYSSYIEGDAQKVYKLGVKNHPPEWLKKKGYWLLAFLNYSEAAEYCKAIKNYDSTVIYKAEADRIKRVDLPRRYDSFIVRKTTEFLPYMLVDWPTGTVMVDGLKLIEKVK